MNRPTMRGRRCLLVLLEVQELVERDIVGRAPVFHGVPSEQFRHWFGPLVDTGARVVWRDGGAVWGVVLEDGERVIFDAQGRHILILAQALLADTTLVDLPCLDGDRYSWPLSQWVQVVANLLLARQA